MKHIHVLVYEDVILSAVSSPLDILQRSNEILLASGKPAAFTVDLISCQHRNVVLDAPVQFFSQKTLADLPPERSAGPDHLILVTPYRGSWDTALEKNRAVIPWLAAQHAAGTEVASLCRGSYFLAEAGLLDGKRYTSHWGAAPELQRRYPQALLQADSVLTDQDGIYTGGGAFTSLNLLLYLVEKFCGHELGVQVSKYFSIHRDHINQAHFSMFRGLTAHGDASVLQAQEWMAQHFAGNVGVEDIAAQVNMSKRNFVRRFKQATQTTPLEYLQKLRIEAAKKALESSTRLIQNVMFEVGYSDNKTFRDVFRRITGVTPQAYRNKYGLEQARQVLQPG